MFRVVLLLFGIFSLGNTNEVENTQKTIQILKLIMRLGNFLPSEDDYDDEEEEEEEDEDHDDKDETTTQATTTTTENNSKK